MRFGSDYCCAYVDLKSDSDQMKGYFCSLKQYAVQDYDLGGYKGKITCSWATVKESSIGIVIAIAMIMGGMLWKP